MFGTMLSGVKSEVFGRKKAILTTHFVALLGFLSLRYANSVPMFYLGNFLGGYTEGVYLVVSPLYVSEINQPKIRNYTLSFNMLSFFFMFSITYIIGAMVSWRQTISILMVFPIIFSFTLSVCPQSPTWHMLHGRRSRALKVLTELRGDEAIANREVMRIEQNLKEQKTVKGNHVNSSSYIKDQLAVIAKGTFIRPCSVLIVLFAIGWQWTGEASLTFYTVDIIQEFKIPINPYWISAGVGIYQLFVAIAGVFISAVVPRRKYYIVSGVFVILGAAILGASVRLQKYEWFIDLLSEYTILRWLPVMALLLYFGGYTSGYVTVPYMLLGELLPSNARSVGSCIVVQCSNVSFFFVTKFTPMCVKSLGMDGLFWLFSIIATLSVIFAYFCVPETFGVSLEEIEEHYRGLCYPNDIQNNNNKTKEYANGAYKNE